MLDRFAALADRLEDLAATLSAEADQYPCEERAADIGSTIGLRTAAIFIRQEIAECEQDDRDPS